MAMEVFKPPSFNITNCVTLTLTDRNYILWKSQFEVFLNGQGLLGFVTGQTPQPPTTIPVPNINGINDEAPHPDYHRWFQTDQMVKSWLLGSFSEDILSVVIDCSTSLEVWNSLASHYNRSTSPRLFELQRKLQTMSKAEKPMDEYLKEIKNICSQLSSIGSPVPERMKVFAALHGLNRDYEPIKTTIESSMDSFPTPTFEEVVPRLTSYDDHLQSYASQSSVTPHLVLYSNRGRGTSHRGRGRGRGNYSTRGRGFHQHLSPSSNSSVSSESEARPVCQICGRVGHHALKCWHRFDNTYQTEDVHNALAALRITDVTNSTGHEWFPDSGATSHVTNSPHHLQYSQAYTGSDSVMVGNGEFLPITHTGSASIATTSGTLPLTDVLVCPDIAKLLMSVSEVTVDYPCAFVFDCDDVRVFDKGTKQLLLRGSRNKGLYNLPEFPQQVFFSSR